MAHGILVPYDGSALAAEAIPYAALLAQRCAAEVIIAQVVAPTREPGELTYDQALRRAFADAGADLDARRLELEGQGLRVLTAVVEGAPVPALLDIARAHAVALTVATTHGRSGPSRWALGSVAEQLLRRTHLPALFLTPKALAAGTSARLLHRLLVPTDGSELGERIFPIAKELALRLRLPITLVQAVDPTPFYSYICTELSGASALVPTPLIAEAEQRVRAELQQRAADWSSEGIDTSAYVAEGAPPTVIERAANEVGAGLLTLSCHGRGGLGGLVLGSTALAVLHQSTLPVLLAAAPSPDRYRLGEEGPAETVQAPAVSVPMSAG